MAQTPSRCVCMLPNMCQHLMWQGGRGTSAGSFLANCASAKYAPAACRAPKRRLLCGSNQRSWQNTSK